MPRRNLLSPKTERTLRLFGSRPQANLSESLGTSVSLFAVREKGDDPQRGAAAALDLHRQSHDVKRIYRKLVQVRDIFERRNVVRHQRHVTFEKCRLTIVDACGVDADRVDLTVFDEPPRRIGMETRKVEI